MKKYDVAVIGGGPAGAAASIAAARGGAKVLLIEKSNCLGGAACNALVQPFMEYTTKVNGEKLRLCCGIFEEITTKLEKMQLEINGWKSKEKPLQFFNEEYLKVLLDRMVIGAGVELLFHTHLIDAESENGMVKSITISNKSGQEKIFADYFIDATGDADLAYKAGFSCRLGREKDRLCQPMTLCFRLGNVDTSKLDQAERKHINTLYQQFQQEGKIKNIRENVLMFNSTLDNVIHFNSTRIVKLNPTDAFDVTKAEIEAREQMMELYLFLKENSPAFKNACLTSSAPEIGVRESRMIDGEYLLTAEDLKACIKFKDSIALGNYDIDIHNPEGSGTSHYLFGDGEYYSIPYRSLVPKGAKNLLAAGRCISATHEAQASIRIMPIVYCLGEAAGTACALAKKEQVPVLKVDTNGLRQILKENGAAV